MTISQNKQSVENFCAKFKTEAISDLLHMMTEDSSWSIMGDRKVFVGAGVKSKTDMESIWTTLFGYMKDGLEMNIIGMIAEGDKVAAEIRSYGHLIDGRVYENQYHMLFTLQRGKIAEVREYTDTLLIAKTFGNIAASALVSFDDAPQA